MRYAALLMLCYAAYVIGVVLACLISLSSSHADAILRMVFMFCWRALRVGLIGSSIHQDLLRTSVWKKDGRILVYGKGLGAGGADFKMYYDEAMEKRRAVQVDLNVRLSPASRHTGKVAAKVYVVSLLRDGARRFCCTQDMDTLACG